mmetsp:Transcript_3096/g.6643  ORF Transcript_3096/g.6643 Transcript_3096/m.6643 type:complete len:282 (+) Transcript_3096:638-1483(+)
MSTYSVSSTHVREWLALVCTRSSLHNWMASSSRMKYLSNDGVSRGSVPTSRAISPSPSDSSNLSASAIISLNSAMSVWTRSSFSAEVGHLTRCEGSEGVSGLDKRVPEGPVELSPLGWKLTSRAATSITSRDATLRLLWTGRKSCTISSIEETPTTDSSSFGGSIVATTSSSVVSARPKCSCNFLKTAPSFAAPENRFSQSIETRNCSSSSTRSSACIVSSSRDFAYVSARGVCGSAAPGLARTLSSSLSLPSRACMPSTSSADVSRKPRVPWLMPSKRVT